MKRNCCIKTLVLTWVGLLICSLSVSAQNGGARAKLPYKTLYELLQFNDEGLGKDYEINTFFVITEGGKALPPKGLEVFLDVEDRMIPVGVSKQGRMQLPDNKDWAKEGVFITTNQPKGSLTLKFDLELSGQEDILKKDDLKYQELMYVLDLSLRIMNSAGKMTGEKFDETLLKFKFQLKNPKEKGQVVTVHAKAGKIEYSADKDGVILIPYKSILYAENPLVELPEGTITAAFNKVPEEVQAPVEESLDDEDV